MRESEISQIDLFVHMNVLESTLSFSFTGNHLYLHQSRESSTNKSATHSWRYSMWLQKCSWILISTKYRLEELYLGCKVRELLITKDMVRSLLEQWRISEVYVQENTTVAKLGNRCNTKAVVLLESFPILLFKLYKLMRYPTVGRYWLEHLWEEVRWWNICSVSKSSGNYSYGKCR